jgi:hypothetical protein
VFTVTVQGTDVIFLAGRTDVVIPPANLPWGPGGTFPTRHPGPTPEEVLETFPTFVPVTGGTVVQLGSPATGGVNFFNGFGPPFFGPDGNGLSGSNLSGLGGISGYMGPQGSIVGVFLNDNVPSSGPAPATLDFTPGGLGTNFLTLSPQLGQVFFIGDGMTSGGVFQQFVAPAGATRLFFGIPDGFGFVGVPGAYDDNDGSFRLRVVTNIPEPGTLTLLAVVGLAAVARIRCRRRIAA